MRGHSGREEERGRVAGQGALEVFDGHGAAILLALAGCVLLAGCVVGRAPGLAEGVRPDLPAMTTYAPNSAISGAELELLNAPNLYQALVRLRPGILRAGRMSPSMRVSEPVVFLDDHLIGDVNELRHLTHVGVREIRRLSRVDLGIRYGRGDLPAAIVIITR